MNDDSYNFEQKVAKEAAYLLYLGVEKEYKQAKLRAARTFGANFLPTNLEVALEMNKIADEREGRARKERLIQMRNEALKIMKILKVYNPKMVGSVWRGTIHRASDIDIVLYQDSPYEIIHFLKQNNFKILQREWITITKRGRTISSLHISLESSTKENVEIVIRGSEEANRRERCEIYGDEIIGLDVQRLETLLRENPTQQFIPT